MDEQSLVYILSLRMSDYRWGLDLLPGLTKHLQIITTSNIKPSLIHTPWFTTAYTKSSQYCCVFTSHWLMMDHKQYPLVLCWQLYHNTLAAPTVLLVTFQHRPCRKHCYSAACVLVGMSIWTLLSYYLAITIVYRDISWHWPSYNCLVHGRCLATGLQHIVITCPLWGHAEVHTFLQQGWVG